MNYEMENKLNIWKFSDVPRKWYRPDLKVRSFFRKIKWAWQRAKYGYCDRDLWNLDYTLGNYIAGSVYRLSKITHGYPHGISEIDWNNILKSIATNFYMGVNEDCYGNIYEKEVADLPPYEKQTEEQKEMWKKYSEAELDINNLMSDHLHNGFTALEKWFPHLWD